MLDGVDGDIDLVSDCDNCCRPINVRATVEKLEKWSGLRWIKLLLFG